MILDWDYSGILSDADEISIRSRLANGEALTRVEVDMRNGSPPFEPIEVLLSPNELAALIPAPKPEVSSTVIE
jgi:hypothetical protein